MARQASPNARNEACVTLLKPRTPCAACLARNLALSSAGVFPTPPCRESKNRGAHSTHEFAGQDRQSRVSTRRMLSLTPSRTVAAFRDASMPPCSRSAAAGSLATSIRTSTRVVHDAANSLPSWPRRLTARGCDADMGMCWSAARFAKQNQERPVERGVDR